jgi:hypothetical protein
MQALQLPASAGWQWIKQAWHLFRQQPLAIMSLFIIFVFTLLLLALLPFIGPLLYGVLMQGLSAGFLIACKQVENKQLVVPLTLVAGFRANDRRAAKPLLILGACYFASALAVLALTIWVDDGTLMQVFRGQKVSEEAFLSSQVTSAMLVAVIGHVLITAIFWYAPALVIWHELGPVKAVFFSVVTVWRNKAAFVVYGLILTGMGLLLQLIMSILFDLINMPLLEGFITFPLLAAYASLIYCSVYTSYRSSIIAS